MDIFFTFFTLLSSTRTNPRQSNVRYNAEGKIAPESKNCLNCWDSSHLRGPHQEYLDHFRHTSLFRPVRRRSLQTMLLPHPRSSPCACGDVLLTRQTWLPAPSSAQDWTITTRCCSPACQKRTSIDLSAYRTLLFGWSLALIGVIISSRFFSSFTGYPSEQERHSRSSQRYSRSDGHINHHTCQICSKNTSGSGHFDHRPSCFSRNRRFK